ncbi:MAG: TonB-dependent receptor [Nitrosomonadales bacterium]
MKAILEAVIAVSILCANVALSQTNLNAPADENSAQSSQVSATTELPAIEVTGHYDNGVGTSDAASQGVVRGELLQDIPLLRPGEALETVPGLVVTQHSGDGKANQYFLRGYNLDHGTDFATTVDGVPVNMPTNAHGQGYSDLNFLIPELVDHIDYRKGTYFAENGDFSSAGSADIHYRKSLDHNLADLTVGSFKYERALLAGSTVLSSLGQSTNNSVFSNTGPTLLGAVELQHEDGPWTTPENLQKVNALARLSDGNIANGWSLDGIHYNATWNSTDQIPLELIDSGQLGRFSALDPTDGGNSGREILSGEWHTSNTTGYTKASAFIEHYRLQLWSNFTFFELRPATGDQFEQAESRNIVGGHIAKGWNHQFPGLDSTTELGLQLRHDNINVGLFNTEARASFASVSNDSVSETSTGLYLQNTTTWNPWLRTLAGLREDTLVMNMTSYALPQNSGSASGSKFSPKLSIILGPWAKTEFFISAGKGFHSNDARGVIDKVDSTQPGTPAIPVPALVSSLGKEFGLRTEAIQGLQSSLALWSLDSDSEIVYSADSAIGSTTPNGAASAMVLSGTTIGLPVAGCWWMPIWHGLMHVSQS